MKIKLFFSLLFALLSYMLNAQSVFELKVKTLDGDSIVMSQFAGKKTLLIVIPLNKQDSVYSQLQKFKTRYKDSVNIIGLVSIEDGYKQAQLGSLKNMFSELKIILTEGLYTKKMSGASQSPLLQWLTDKNKNHHFNNDASGIGTKFFINESGRLFAVLPPQASLQNQLIDRIVHSSMAKQ